MQWRRACCVLCRDHRLKWRTTSTQAHPKETPALVALTLLVFVERILSSLKHIAALPLNEIFFQGKCNQSLGKQSEVSFQTPSNEVKMLARSMRSGINTGLVRSTEIKP